MDALWLDQASRREVAHLERSSRTSSWVAFLYEKFGRISGPIVGPSSGDERDDVDMVVVEEKDERLGQSPPKWQRYVGTRLAREMLLYKGKTDLGQTKAADCHTITFSTKAYKIGRLQYVCTMFVVGAYLCHSDGRPQRP